VGDGVASTDAAARHLSYGEARACVLDAVRPLAPVEVPLAAALGRPLRSPVRAPHPLPPFTNSSMDGYTVRAADAAGARRDRPVELPVVEVIAAGHVASRPLGRGEAMRIMTGAAMPEGADTVVPFEQADAGRRGETEILRFVSPPVAGANVRRAGADIDRGDVALEAGRALSPHDLALAGSLGIPRVHVGPRPRVAIVSTGDELLAIDAPLRPGAIRDSNSLQLALLVAEAGGEVVASSRAPDDPAEVARAIRQALDSADVALTIGGVSAGDFDPVRDGLGRVGGIELWRVAMKPGRPQAFGAPDGRLFFGLPGNPGSVACVFEVLVRPALLALQGFESLDRPRVRARAAHDMASRKGRRDFVRVTLERRERGWWASEAGAQVSGHLTPQAQAHALFVIPEHLEEVEAEEAGEAFVLRWPEDPAEA